MDIPVIMRLIKRTRKRRKLTEVSLSRRDGPPIIPHPKLPQCLEYIPELGAGNRDDICKGLSTQVNVLRSMIKI
jgi:hypothetical protein